MNRLRTNRLRTNQNAFTLLELMVVIAIISILALITAPTFTRQITKAKLVEAQNIAAQSQSFIEEYILLNGTFPTATEFTEIAPSISNSDIVQSIAVNNPSEETGSFRVTLKSNTGISEGDYFEYTRNAERYWQCESNLASNVLPQQCTSTAE
ncbi:MAG: pilin [Marinomonas sp.]